MLPLNGKGVIVRRVLRIGGRAAGSLAIICAGYFVLLSHPQPLFGYSATYSNITFYSHSPLGGGVARIALAVHQRLTTSPLYDPAIKQQVFVVEWPWLWALLNGPYRGAIARNVEIGDPILIPTLDVTSEQIRHFDGRRASAVHILTHEAVHTLVRRRIGIRRLWRLQWWQKEGYPEYIASRGGIEIEAPTRYQQAARAWKILLEQRHMSFDDAIDLRGAPPEVFE
jgi:hypothetical protein